MQYIIDFQPNISLEDIENYLTSNNCTILKVYNNFNNLYLVEANTAPELNSLVDSITQDDLDNAIELLAITTIISDQLYAKKNTVEPLITIENDDKNWWKSYTIKNADLDNDSYEINLRGQCSTVYILDSGVEISHDEFVNKKVSNLWSFNGDFTDKNGHGTAIASVVVGNTCGITDSTVKSVKIFDPSTPTKQSDLLSALDIIFSDIVNNQIEFPIVNCSWVISKNDLIDNKIKSMIDQGIYFVVSAGNNGVPVQDVTPACILSAVTVGAYDQNLLPCDFSNYTNSIISLTSNETNYGELDIWAPGKDIWCAGLNNSYGYVSGTSISAAIQSASLAYNFSLSEVNWKAGYNSIDFCMVNSYSRQHLLDLSDSKYSLSKNLVTTVADQIIHPPDLEMYSWTITTDEDSWVWRKLFIPENVEKLELFNDLPDNYKISTSGYFYGRSPKIIEDFTHTKISIKMTMVDGEIFETELDILNRKKDFSGPTNDPVLDMRLQSRAYNCTVYPFGTCIDEFQNDRCIFDCPPGQGCSQYSDDKLCNPYFETYCTGCYPL